MQPDLSIVIVSWNVRDLLASCLRSIAAGSDGTPLTVEVIVVDSGSSDDTLDMLASEFEWVQAIDTGENVGFAKGNNIGFAVAQGRNVLLLNPDTEIVGNALPQLTAYLDEHPEVGAIGPQLLESDRSSVQSSRRRFPTLATAFFESTWLQPVAPRAVLDRYYMQDVDDNQIAHVDWVTGAAILTRKSVLDEVGGLDESYFMYSEEMDWCRRVKNAGREIVYYPQAQVVHHGGKSSEQVVAHKHIYFQRSKVRYFAKHHSKLAALVLRFFLLGSYFFQLLLEAFKGLLGHKRDLRRERVRAYWQVLRSGLRA